MVTRRAVLALEPTQPEARTARASSNSNSRRDGRLAARGKSRVGVRNGDCHQFASGHNRNKALGLKRIGWLYPIFRDPYFHHWLLSTRSQAAAARLLCGSRMNFFAAPLSKSLYPVGASSSVMTVAFTALAICTLSCRMAIISPRWYFITGH